MTQSPDIAGDLNEVLRKDRKKKQVQGIQQLADNMVAAGRWNSAVVEALGTKYTDAESSLSLLISPGDTFYLDLTHGRITTHVDNMFGDLRVIEATFSSTGSIEATKRYNTWEAEVKWKSILGKYH